LDIQECTVRKLEKRTRNWFAESIALQLEKRVAFAAHAPKAVDSALRLLGFGPR